MAEAIGAAAGVVALAQAAFESSVSLYQLVKSFQSHNSRVRELGLEVGALCEVLGGLSEHLKATKVHIPGLDVPLRQCGHVCADFRKILADCSARSNDTRTSFRDWARLKYMGDDIDGFRRMVSSYKLTMTIALNDANLQASAETAESVESYHDLIQTTQEDLRDRLQGMDEKLNHLLETNGNLSGAVAQEAKLIQGERLSTQRCLQICADLSSRIAQLRLNAKSSTATDETAPATAPERIYSDGLQECAQSLARTAEKLAACEGELLDRLMDNTQAANLSEDESASFSRLRNELNAMRESMAICAKAQEHLREEVATIENHATGDAVQLMVSTNDKPIHGKNSGTGWRTRQLGGYVDKLAVRDAIRSFSVVTIPTSAGFTQPSPEKGHVVVNDSAPTRGPSAFTGEGHSLSSRHA